MSRKRRRPTPTQNRASNTGRQPVMDASPMAVANTQKSSQRATAKDLTPGRMYTMDVLVNELARIGVDNIMTADAYAPTRLTQNWTLLDTLYRSDWIVNRIINTVPEDATKNWYKMTAAVTPDQTAILEKSERKLHIREDIQEALRWGRLYGGAAAIMIIKGQEDCLDEPLDLDTVMPGSFRGLIVVDRWNGITPSGEIVTDISDPDVGLPEYYIFNMPDAELDQGIRIHHSRVLRFTGRDLPYIEKVNEMYWGMSEIEHVYSELEKRNVTSANIAQLIFQAHLRVLKIEDLGQALAMDDPQSQSDLWSTLSAQNALMNNFALQVLSKDDDFQTFQYTFSGLSDVYEQFMMDLAGAAEIPATKLFGRAPQGMNSTGEGDIRNYYDTVKQYQEHMLRPVLERLLPVMCVSAWGAVPDDLDFEFNPVRDTNDEERASLIQQTAGAIIQVYQAGLISQQIALIELRKSGRAFDMWSSVTDEAIAEADPNLQPMDEMGGGGSMEEQMAAMMGMGGGGEEQEEPQGGPQMPQPQKPAGPAGPGPQQGPKQGPPQMPPAAPQRPPMQQPMRNPSAPPQTAQRKPQPQPQGMQRPQAKPQMKPQPEQDTALAQKHRPGGVMEKILSALRILFARKEKANETTGQGLPKAY